MSARSVIIIPEKPELKREASIRQELVAAYCRVSTEEEEQQSSYENQCKYYTDLITYLDDDIHVENTKVHFIYARKMGEKYLRRYKKYFRDPDIREFDMQHEQWLFGGEEYARPVLEAIDEFMDR